MSKNEESPGLRNRKPGLNCDSSELGRYLDRVAVFVINRFWFDHRCRLFLLLSAGSQKRAEQNHCQNVEEFHIVLRCWQHLHSNNTFIHLSNPCCSNRRSCAGIATLQRFAIVDLSRKWLSSLILRHYSHWLGMRLFCERFRRTAHARAPVHQSGHRPQIRCCTSRRMPGKWL